MPIELDDIEQLLTETEEAFRRSGQRREDGLDVSDAGLIQPRKACRSLTGADQLLADGYPTLAIEAAFTSVEKTLLFWLIYEGYHDPADPPQSHTTAIERGSEVGYLDDEVASRLVDLWNANRAQTYYQYGLATLARAESLLQLTNRIHTYIVDLVGVHQECVCE